ncbi:ectonucleoside triphosphate diphosphohydrolase 7-like isoform X2 [Panonychus citri]|uniref:ectonucleoside triphosphate diphosphohydrolase 7-like isoform X2 n=1 Tax=Panonychus citri TaxID=50023 RepID=UPI002307078A|nr:ectonucleoside triphosphate diphosphohydrolase 7-like isoform X2 [Panonychus citri]
MLILLLNKTKASGKYQVRVNWRYNYLRLFQRLFFTGKIRFILILIFVGFILIYLVKALQNDETSIHMNVNSFEFEDLASSLSENHNYAVLIDAGSSGSRVHLYTWPPNSADNRRLLKIKMMKDKLGKDLYKKITPGLSSLSANPQDAYNYIYPLLEFANNNIPSFKHRETPLYIFATAGMRLLPKESQDAILTNLRDRIKLNSTFSFSPSNVQVITGKEEGIYSWISVNYLLGRFDHSIISGETKSLVAINLGNGITTRPRTVSMLEMGGASVQIAFEITSKYELEEIRRRRGVKSQDDMKDVIAQFNLGCYSHDSDHSYLLYVTTYLGLGANVAKDSYLTFILDQQLKFNKETPVNFNSKSSINSTNQSNNYLPSSASSAVLPPSAIGLNKLPTPAPSIITLKDPCLCKNCPYTRTVISLNGSQYNLSLIGTGDFEHCEANLRNLMTPKYEVNSVCRDKNTTCPLKQLTETRVDFTDTEFFGFSEFWYSMEDVLKIGGKYNYFNFKKAASEYCSTDYVTLKDRFTKNLYPNADPSRLADQCFKTAWISTLLHNGFRMPKTFKNFQSALSIKNNQVQWTLGALLYRIGVMSPTNAKEIQSQSAVVPDLSTFHNLVFLFCMALVLAIIVIYLKHLNYMINTSGKLTRSSDMLIKTDLLRKVRSSDTIVLIDRNE